MAKNKINYTEISSASVTEKRKIVISTCSKGGFTVAQRMDTEEENNKTTSLYLKGAFHINDITGLYNLRDAINLAISKVESGELDSDEYWDE